MPARTFEQVARASRALVAQAQRPGSGVSQSERSERSSSRAGHSATRQAFQRWRLSGMRLADGTSVVVDMLVEVISVHHEAFVMAVGRRFYVRSFAPGTNNSVWLQPADPVMHLSRAGVVAREARWQWLYSTNHLALPKRPDGSTESPDAGTQRLRGFEQPAA